MKKATAFLTLIFLIVIAFLFYFVNSGQFHPNWQDLEPIIELLKSFIAAEWQKPAVAGLAIFWITSFLLSLMVLREPRTNKNTAINTAATAKIAAEKVATAEQLGQLAEKLATTEKEREELKQNTTDMQRQIQNLREHLDKLSAPAIESEAEKQLKQKFADVEANLKTANYDKSRISSENEALTTKIEKIEQENKTTRREAEKATTQLKNITAELEKKSEEVGTLKKQIEDITQELKSTQANLKGGKETIPPAAYQILYLFQKEGRLIDLLCEDISELDDETLGGAIRPIHEGCRKLLDDRLILERVLNEDEGSEVTVDEIDPEAIKLSGKVPAKGPYTGELIHRGWRLKECILPELVDGWKGNVIAPAEIEIS